MQNQSYVDFYVRLGQRIKKHREGRRMTQESLAQKVGLGRTSVTNIEKGSQQILAHQAVLFAKALEIDVDQLVSTGVAAGPEQAMSLLPEGASEQEKAWVMDVMTRKM